MSIGWYHPLRHDGEPQRLDQIHDPRARRWYEDLYRACPSWVTRDMIKPYYDQMRKLNRMGADVTVDHQVPLHHPLVCGLHVPANLRVIGAQLNVMKSNKWWPDMPYRQESFLGCPEQPEQYHLNLQGVAC